MQTIIATITKAQWWNKNEFERRKSKIICVSIELFVYGSMMKRCHSSRSPSMMKWLGRWQPESTNNLAIKLIIRHSFSKVIWSRMANYFFFHFHIAKCSTCSMQTTKQLFLLDFIQDESLSFSSNTERGSVGYVDENGRFTTHIQFKVTPLFICLT